MLHLRKKGSSIERLVVRVDWVLSKLSPDAGCGKSTFMRRMIGVFGGLPHAPEGMLLQAVACIHTLAERCALALHLASHSWCSQSVTGSHDDHFQQSELRLQAATPTPTHYCQT